MIYTIVGDNFRRWVLEHVKHRNDHLAEKHDLMIELDPEIAAAFGNSLNISSKSELSDIGGVYLSFDRLFTCSDQGPWRSHP